MSQTQSPDPLAAPQPDPTLAHTVEVTAALLRQSAFTYCYFGRRRATSGFIASVMLMIAGMILFAIGAWLLRDYALATLSSWVGMIMAITGVVFMVTASIGAARAHRDGERWPRFLFQLAGGTDAAEIAKEIHGDEKEIYFLTRSQAALVRECGVARAQALKDPEATVWVAQEHPVIGRSGERVSYRTAMLALPAIVMDRRSDEMKPLRSAPLVAWGGLQALALALVWWLAAGFLGAYLPALGAVATWPLYLILGVAGLSFLTAGLSVVTSLTVLGLGSFDHRVVRQVLIAIRGGLGPQSGAIELMLILGVIVLPPQAEP
jgi:hypothetical protein